MFLPRARDIPFFGSGWIRSGNCGILLHNVVWGRLGCAQSLLWGSGPSTNDANFPNPCDCLTTFCLYHWGVYISPCWFSIIANFILYCFSSFIPYMTSPNLQLCCNKTPSFWYSFQFYSWSLILRSVSPIFFFILFIW